MTPTGRFPTLAALLAPFDVERFVDQHWERAPLHVRRAEAGPPLASLAELDAILTGRPHRHPDVSLVDAARPVEVDEYAFPDDVLDPIRAVKRFAAGATIIINRFDESAPRVRALCAALEAELGILVQANLYLTPRGAQGFPVHYDNHDVIVVQCEGRKAWRLYDAPKALPMRGERFEAAATKPGPKSQDLVLEPGDALYVPRGLMHDAVAADDGVSVHLTIGLHAVRWSEVLIEALAAASLDDLELRRGLPLGALVGGAGDAALAKAMRAHVERVLGGVRWDRVRDRVEAQYLHGHKERLDGLLLDASAALDADAVFVRREGARITLAREGDAVVLWVQGRATRWPAHAAPALEAALAEPRFTLADLGRTLDDKGKLTLVRRLLAEGAVRVERAATPRAQPAPRRRKR